MARTVTTIRMWTKDHYSQVVGRLSEEQVHVSFPPGVRDGDPDIIAERNGGQFCAGLTVDPKKFPEAVKFTVVVEHYA